MKIETRDFGEMEIDPSEIISFRLPVYGFEALSNYVLLYDDDLQSPFTWLQSTQDKDVCFILATPELVGLETYQPTVSGETRKLLNLAEGQEPVCRIITVIPERFQDATVNLKSPVLINPAFKCAAQIILDQDYPIKARLMPQEEGERKC